MALKIKFKDGLVGIGDRVRVVQKIKDGEKSRESTFEGMIIAIKGRNPGKTFVVRRIAEGGIGVERIFPIELPSIDRITVVKRGTEGAKRAKLYYTRQKAPTEVEMIFKRTAVKTSIKVQKKTGKLKSATKKRNKKSRK